MKIPNKIYVSGIFILVVIWQLLLTFQGFDLADTGFQLSAYRFILDDPYSVQYSMMFWLSDITGALWMKLFPAGGLYWFRVGWVLAITATFLIYFRILQQALSRNQAVISLAITLIFILRGGPECLNYDILTSVGYAIGLLFLIGGLIKNKPWQFAISGFFLGISLFFKLSNLTLLSFFLAIPFAHLIYKRTRICLLQNSAIWLLGIISGAGLIIGLILYLGHWELFTNNLTFIYQMGSDSQASHGLLPLLKSYITGYANAGVMLLFFALGVWGFIRLTKQKPIVLTSRVRVSLLILISITVLFLSIFLKDVFWSKVRYLFIGLMILYGLMQTTDRKQNQPARTLAFIGLILLIIAPLGSDSGLSKSVWGMWLLAPLTLSGFFEIRLIKRNVLPAILSNLFRKMLFVTILISAVVYAWQNTYFDVGSRIEKRFSIEHPNLDYIYTSEKRANAINETIAQAFPKMNDCEYLLSFIEMPMFNYLTGKKPFISTSWPKLYYNPKTFQEKLVEAVNKRDDLPAIIRQKQATKLDDWPETPYVEYKDWPEHATILDKFISQYNYNIVWENEMFQLLIAKGL